ncbi:MAG: hypothetical protein AMJ53_03635 [Gammaproteobacteria bacterium SG8_11]|nr:MAG: hypothetical protein AMJ53_03635 [Gammaproteobacteria bacterium SG8_11]
MIGRLVVNIGIFLAGYYIGKQIGLTEHIRKDIDEKRNRKQLPDKTSTEKTRTTRKKQRTP